MNDNAYLKANRSNWDERVAIHMKDSGEIYDVEGFLAGKDTLRDIERDALGDVTGKTLLHLMCHFGLDTLSWARKGAKVTGVDFSEKAITAAKDLAKQTGLNAEFLQADVNNLSEKLAGTFDIVFASYGVICWLPDMPAFMGVVAHFLENGGLLLLVDNHPLVDIFEYDADAKRLDVAWPYFHKPDPDACEVTRSYAGSPRTLKHATTYQWSHDLASILDAVSASGLHLTAFREYPFSCYARYPDMARDDAGNWRFVDPKIEIPMLFSIMAVKT